MFQHNISERRLNCEYPSRIFIMSTSCCFKNDWIFSPATQSLILGHCQLQYCPHQKHRWLMLMPERLTLSCLCLCPCPYGTCSNTVTKCDPSHRNCGTGNRCSLCLAVSTVACVSVSLYLWPCLCEAFCHQFLQLPLAPVCSAKSVATREHSQQQHEPLHTLCGLADAGFAVAVLGPS